MVEQGLSEFLFNFLDLLLYKVMLVYLLPSRLNVEEQILPVASHLPPGYLSVQSLGLGKGVMVIKCYKGIVKVI
jgi:hypothetical protein